jgi:hypothetical protein
MMIVDFYHMLKKFKDLLKARLRAKKPLKYKK